MDAGELRIGKLLLVVDPRGTEVVAQTQRVANLVHHRVLDVVGDEVLGPGAVGLEFPARLEHVQRVGQLLGRQLAVHALFVAGVVAMAAQHRCEGGRARQGLHAQAAQGA